MNENFDDFADSAIFLTSTDQSVPFPDQKQELPEALEVDAHFAGLSQQLENLTELFVRRLKDDQDKRKLIEKLYGDSQKTEDFMFSAYIQPMVISLGLVIDRLISHAGADPGFIESVVEEILESFRMYGINPIETVGNADLSKHEIVGRRGSTLPPGTILAETRMGFARGTTVIRAAHVIVSSGGEETYD